MKYLPILLLLLFVPILPDIFGSPNSFILRASIPSESFLILAIVLFTTMRITYHYKIKHPFQLVFLLLFVGTGMLSIILTGIDNLTHVNFVFNLLKINYDKLLYISLASGFIWLGSFPGEFFRQYYKLLLFLISIFLFFVGLLIWTWPFEKLATLTKEDSITEYLQFFVLLLGSFFSFRVAKNLWANTILIALLYMFMGLILFAVAGDEISWGQRLFSLQTPSTLREINRQQEITFHNINSYEVFVTYGYIFISLYGSVISLLARSVASFKHKDYILPKAHLFFYFFIPLCIQSSFILPIQTNFHEFAELSELILYLGVTLFIVELSLFSKSTKHKKT